VTWQSGLDNVDSMSSCNEFGDLAKWTWQHGLNKFMIWTWWLGKMDLTTWTQQVLDMNFRDLVKWTWQHGLNELVHETNLVTWQNGLCELMKSMCSWQMGKVYLANKWSQVAKLEEQMSFHNNKSTRTKAKKAAKSKLHFHVKLFCE